jgi:hypothetical protein
MLLSYCRRPHAALNDACKRMPSRETATKKVN